MGKLVKNTVFKKRRDYKKLLMPVAAIALVAGLWGLHRITSTHATLFGYAAQHHLKVGVDQKKNVGQIYYEYRGRRIFVTHDDINHLSPKAGGIYLAWLDETNGQYQVVRYDLQTGRQLPLSLVGSNSNPSIDGPRVAWESVINNQASILFFDGLTVKKISGKLAAVRPFVHGQQVLYAQKTNGRNDIWQTVEYDSVTGKSKVVAEGSAAKAAWPRFDGGKIKTSIVDSAKYYY